MKPAAASSSAASPPGQTLTRITTAATIETTVDHHPGAGCDPRIRSMSAGKRREMFKRSSGVEPVESGAASEIRFDSEQKISCYLCCCSFSNDRSKMSRYVRNCTLDCSAFHVDLERETSKCCYLDQIGLVDRDYAYIDAPEFFPQTGALPLAALTEDSSSMSSLKGRTTRRYERGRLHIKRRREKSTKIVIAIVSIFLFCHACRLALQFYIVLNPSLSTSRHYKYCFNKGMFHLPVYIYFLMSFRNFLLVINSSVNFFIYVFVEESFRNELRRICAPFIKFVTALKKRFHWQRFDESGAAAASGSGGFNNRWF